MALVIKDRVKETTTTTGTGTYTLAGAEVGFQSFSAIGDGNTTYYSCTDFTDWEVGIGTYNATGTTLARTTILSSSNSDNAVDWGSGTKYIFVTQPASKASYVDADGNHIGNNFATHIDFNTTEATKPAYSEGRLFYDEEYGALGFYNEEQDVTLQIGQESWVRVYNNTGASITDGDPVYATGAFGEAITIALADATTEDKANVVGLATHTIENNSYGYVTVRGLLSGLDTSAFTAGDRINLSPSGGLQVAPPTYPYYPTELGICIVSDASNGYIYATIDHHTFDQFRVTGNTHMDGNLTVDGDLTVLGTQTIASSNNISISSAWNYFNSGDTIGDANTSFSGSGLDDATLVGHYKGTASTQTYYVRIDGVGTGTGGVDTFEWSLDNFTTTEATTVDITGSEQSLVDGVKVEFNATTGHTSGDTWSGSASPSNVDTGVASNRNTGSSGVGYTHIGAFYDISTGYWTFFDEYDPEPEGDIDVSHASFNYATLKADTYIGSLSGNATTASTLETARTLSLIGDVTGSASFDGSGNVSITTVVADDSHDHSNYVEKAGDTMTGTLEVPTVDFGDWTITETSGSLYFAYQGTNKFKLDNTGTLSVTNDVLTDETIT